MATQVMTAGATAGGNFLDSPVFSGRRSNTPPELMTSDPLVRSAIPSLDLDTTENDLHSSPDVLFTTNSTSPSFVATPDSGFSGVASSIRSKTPDLDSLPPSAMSHSLSGGSGSVISSGGGRKRKTVTIDESQTSIVVISPDDLFDTYSKSQGQGQR